MAIIKNTFLKSKMNKDLDSRLVPNGEYREAVNVGISSSEGSDVGALETIRGNISITNFGLKDKDLEIIGYCTDPSKNRIAFFITNYNDENFNNPNYSRGLNNTVSNLSHLSGISGNIPFLSVTQNAPKHYICLAEIDSNDIDINVVDIKTTILVSGTFLNFSKINIICGSNIIDDLLFWTDNRNQPRKINIKTALGEPFVDDNNPGYYTNEDHISVAKYAPYNSVSFLKKTNGYEESTLKNSHEKYLAPIIGITGEIVNNPTNQTDCIRFYKDDQNYPNQNIYNLLNAPIPGFNSIADPLYWRNIPMKVTLLDDPNGNFGLVNAVWNTNHVFLRRDGDTGTSNFPPPFIFDITDELGWKKGRKYTFMFSPANPDYDEQFNGDIELLEDKFVRFSYRFKYDDGEYSLAAPFSQHAFVPKQYGYFIGDDENKSKESSIVNFMENQISSVGMVIDLPCESNKLWKEYKVRELQLLYKDSSEQSLKVISEVPFDNPRNVKGCPKEIERNQLPSESNIGFEAGEVYKTTGGSGTGLTVRVTVDSIFTNIITAVVENTGEGYVVGDIVRVISPLNSSATQDCSIKIKSLTNTFIYNYKSQRPIKVLPESEIIRVSDIVPIRAKTQEVIGNRVVYGNFVQNLSTPLSLKYSVSSLVKGSTKDENGNIINTNIEFNNHTLKQGRTYQAGIVLIDRYGRSSNVILNDTNDADTNSTFYASYTDGRVDPLTWSGNSMVIDFKEQIPVNRTNNYLGVYKENKNPIGFYTYKVVVKQQEQDYYNIYVPGAVSGNVKFTGWINDLEYTNENSVAQIALFNDNINKIPRNLNEVGPSDRIYSSSEVLFNRVKQTRIYAVPDINLDGDLFNNEQNSDPKKIEISSLQPFRELGDWTLYKGVDLQHTTDGPAAAASNSSGSSLTYSGETYIYPGLKGDVDPFYLENSKNPIIASLSTVKRLGLDSLEQFDGSINKPNNDNNWKFAKELMVFETKPIKSNIEIYYETSTTGLINDFNQGVIDNFGTTEKEPGGISEIIWNVEETDKFGTAFPVTNVFEGLNIQGNSLLDSSTIIELIQIKRGGTIQWQPTMSSRPIFDIRQATAGSGLTTAPTYEVYLNSPIVYDNYNNRLFEVKLRVSNSTNPTGVDVDYNFELTNIKPRIYKIYGYPNPMGASTAGDLIDEFNDPNSPVQPGVNPPPNKFDGQMCNNNYYHNYNYGSASNSELFKKVGSSVFSPFVPGVNTSGYVNWQWAVTPDTKLQQLSSWRWLSLRGLGSDSFVWGFITHSTNGFQNVDEYNNTDNLDRYYRLRSDSEYSNITFPGAAASGNYNSQGSTSTVDRVNSITYRIKWDRWDAQLEPESNSPNRWKAWYFNLKEQNQTWERFRVGTIPSDALAYVTSDGPGPTYAQYIPHPWAGTTVVYSKISDFSLHGMSTRNKAKKRAAWLFRVHVTMIDANNNSGKMESDPYIFGCGVYRSYNSGEFYYPGGVLAGPPGERKIYRGDFEFGMDSSSQYYW